LRKIIIKIAFIFFLFSCSAFSQENIIQDSLQTGYSSDDSVFVMQKSPLKAVLLSAVVPGLGQIYNESYWKVPVILGLGYYFVSVWVDNNNLYWKYARLYSKNQIGDYKRVREFYRDQRDQFAVYIGLTYILTLVDAYVDAQLFDFNVLPDPVTFSPQLQISIKF